MWQSLGITATVSTADSDLSELSPRKQHPFPQMKARQGPLFAGGDYVII